MSSVDPAIATPLGRRQMVVGGLLAFVTVTIWAIWIVGTRQAVTVHLPLGWIGILRFGIPAVVLAPFWWRHGLLPKGIDRRLIAIMVIGSGAPFFVVVVTGLRFAAAGQVGVLLPGTMPLFVALLSAVVSGERYSLSRLVGFALVTLALLATGGSALWAGQGFGVLLIPFGAFLWGCYTLAFRKSGLDAIAATGLIAAWSTILLLPFVLTENSADFFHAEPWILAGQFLSQSVLSGVVALVCYGLAVRMLGSSRAAIFSALAPPLAALLAIPVLGEVPSLLTLIGVALAVVGVALGSGAVGARR